MTPAATLRIGSLEILAALAAFGYLSRVLRVRPAEARPKAVRLALSVHDIASRQTEKSMDVIVAEGSPIFIGRSAEAGVALSDPEVSRRHARLELVRGVVYLADSGSRNGTFLNGKRLPDESIEVRPGDDIDVGNTRITVSGTLPER